MQVNLSLHLRCLAGSCGPDDAGREIFRLVWSEYPLYCCCFFRFENFALPCVLKMVYIERLQFVKVLGPVMGLHRKIFYHNYIYKGEYYETHPSWCPGRW